jgi:hypothetical protein
MCCVARALAPLRGAMTDEYGTIVIWTLSFVLNEAQRKISNLICEEGYLQQITNWRLKYTYALGTQISSSALTAGGREVRCDVMLSKGREIRTDVGQWVSQRGKVNCMKRMLRWPSHDVINKHGWFSCSRRLFVLCLFRNPFITYKECTLINEVVQSM